MKVSKIFFIFLLILNTNLFVFCKRKSKFYEMFFKFKKYFFLDNVNGICNTKSANYNKVKCEKFAFEMCGNYNTKNKKRSKNVCEASSKNFLHNKCSLW